MVVEMILRRLFTQVVLTVLCFSRLLWAGRVLTVLFTKEFQKASPISRPGYKKVTDNIRPVIGGMLDGGEKDLWG